MNEAAIDSNVLVAIIDSRDKWHRQAKELVKSLKKQQITQMIYFDCVINETVSVLGRRLEEKKRSNEFVELVEKMQTLIPHDIIAWVSPEIPRLYDEILELTKQTTGQLNFHDALIALKCRELKVKSILSFDEDFDSIDWIKRIH